MGGGIFSPTFYMCKNQAFVMNIKGTKNRNFVTGVEKKIMEFLEAD